MTYQRFAPEDVAHTSGALFFTRFITHFCAPVIRFPGWHRSVPGHEPRKVNTQVSRFFWTRGLWLVLLELTIVDFGWGLSPAANASVIWVLGWSMVVMALIVYLPVRWIAALDWA